MRFLGPRPGAAGSLGSLGFRTRTRGSRSTAAAPETVSNGPPSSAPEEGGPFVTVSGGRSAIEREPRVRVPETQDPKEPAAPASPTQETA